MDAILSRGDRCLTSDNKESKEADNIGVFDNSSSKICLLGFEQALHKNRKRNR